MFIIVPNVRSFIASVTSTAVTPTAVILLIRIFPNLPEVTYSYLKLPEFLRIYLNFSELLGLYLNIPEFTLRDLKLPKAT